MTWLLAALMGLSLGLVGAGGSILTVPLLVYGFGVPAETATGGAFVVVGILSVIGALQSAAVGNIDLRTLAIFAPVSVVMAITSRAIFFAYAPRTVGKMPFSVVLMTAFALLIIWAAYAMSRPSPIRSESIPNSVGAKEWQIAPLILSAISVGILSGILGAGGGFLIIPALVLRLGIALPIALGTSLGIISINCATGISLDVVAGRHYPWDIVLPVTLVALVGMFLGMILRSKLTVSSLKQAFAVTLVLVAVFVLVKEWLNPF